MTTTEDKMKIPLEMLCGVSMAGFFASVYVIPKFRKTFLKANLFGVDMNKNSGSKVPEATGVITGSIFLSIAFLMIPFTFSQYLMRDKSSGFPHQEFCQMLAALLSISSMLLLGFADDVLDLKWRHKLALPTLASLPLLMVYFVTTDRTVIVVPLFLRSLIGTHVDLGLLYYLYMGLLAVFCTNAINILAGINGLEVGQAIVIAASVATFNFREMNGPLGDYHRFSLFLLVPFLATSLGLLWHNWYPASVFCGDTFCYYSGMTLAVVAILGHFSKTLLLFFIPQILNFLYSVPQLFHFIPCPRHRLPKYDPESDAVHFSKVTFRTSQMGFAGRLMLRILSNFKLAYVRSKPEGNDDYFVEMNNLTLINFFLRIFGPMNERSLTVLLLTFQVFCSLVAFLIRYPLALVFYGEIIA